MAEKFDSLSGRWLGRYDQPFAVSVPFEAHLIEDGGVLTGETTEPNTFRRDLGATLTATLSGDQTGHAVIFAKRYHQFSHESLVYDGVANTALTRISGRWSFPGFPGVNGRFTMMRKPLAAARAVRRTNRAVPEAVG